eukprot:12245213-Alexandrium_andersonii.AAC.1
MSACNTQCHIWWGRAPLAHLLVRAVGMGIFAHPSLHAAIRQMPHSDINIGSPQRHIQKVIARQAGSHMEQRPLSH